MKTISRIIIFTISIIITLPASAQDTVNCKTVFPSGIFADPGTFISPKKFGLMGSSGIKPANSQTLM